MLTQRCFFLTGRMKPSHFRMMTTTTTRKIAAPSITHQQTTTGIIHGGCYCGNISLRMTIPPSHLASQTARACDCGFCRKHGAAYISDPNGSLEIQVKETSALGRFRQEQEDNAEFLHCKRCSVLIGAIHQCIGEESAEGIKRNRIIAAVNRLAIENADALFPQVTSIQPRLLTKEDKVKRWKEKWFQDVKIMFQSS